ncbi:Guanine nucleotide exchange factor SRM1 [Metarhizium brunneum]|uniref:Guanine nucleotide exchange factor SRM1 n=1 Tax=Metarhizium brunneum TaxID=500148 RepID=A0A7D5Z6Z5_9HYPO|nr:Guanine nucleotide exchange factor SRM1 [Metarhizium brunneum]
MASKKLTSTSRKENPTKATVIKKEPAKPAKRATVAKKNTSEPVVNGKTHNEPDPKPTKRKRVAEEDEDDVARRRKTIKNEAPKERKHVKPVAKKPVKKEKPIIEEPAALNKAPTELIAVFSFGSGECGELGLGPKRTAALVPKFNPALDPNEASKYHIVQLACGGMHTIALTADNKILTWGVNDEGALGRDTAWEGGLKDMDAESDSGDEDGELNPHECTPTEVPSKNFPKGTVFTQVAAGDSCSFVLTQTGSVYGWGSFRDNKGDRRFTKTQNDKVVEIQNDPILIPELENVIQITCGANHALALDKSGQVWGWGSYEQNQLGRQPFGRYQQETLLPRQVRVCTRPIKYIASGEYHSFAVDRKDNVWAWGLNSFGEAGYAKEAGGDEAILPYPMKIRDLCGKGVVSMAGGTHHSGAVTEDGKVYMWGRLDGGQLGIDFSQSQLDDEHLVRRDEYNKPRICLRPTVVPELGNVVDVACGTDHTIFINNEGVGYATGFGSVGQLGLGNEDDSNTAQRIRGKDIKGRKLVGAAAGGQFSVVTSTSAVPKTE